MNAIQSLDRFYFYMNVSQSARLYRYEIDIAFNDAIQQFINEKLGDPKERSPENFQWVQSVRDDLSTLIKESTTAPTNGTAITNRYYTSIPSNIVNPNDYYQLVLIMCLIDGYWTYARPTSYNESGPMLENTFTHPTNDKPYYNEKSGNYTIWRGEDGTFTSATMTYIKAAASFTVGAETQLINGGPAVTLTNLLTYYATEVSVYNGVTYQIGSTITGVTAQLLTSGQVILSSNTTPIELPEKTHDQVCKMAAVIALKNLSSFDNAQAVESEVDKV